MDMYEADRRVLRQMFRPFYEEDKDNEGEEEEPRFPGRRVENLGKSVEEWSEQTGNGSSTIDLCESHARELDQDPHCFDEHLRPYNGDPVGEDGWGGDCAHPPYDECDYHCAIPDCQVLLGSW